MTGRKQNTDSGQRVESRQNTTHAVGTRRRGGRRVTVCGREIDHQFTARGRGAAIDCSVCAEILKGVRR
jgi:hypothetical protein